MNHLLGHWIRRFGTQALLFTTLSLGGMGVARSASAQVYGLFRAEELEYAYDDNDNPITWDTTSWVGGDWNRVWLKTEGEVLTLDSELEAEAQLLYSRLIAPFWEFQIGFRGDIAATGVGTDDSDTERLGYAVVGLEGLAPYWFELEPVLFVSQDGDISARVAGSYDTFITQRLITSASFEVNAAAQSVPSQGVGSGLNDLQLGLRLRYELRRKFAPYFGVSWERRFGETADLLIAAGGEEQLLQAVGGLRFWF